MTFEASSYSTFSCILYIFLWLANFCSIFYFLFFIFLLLAVGSLSLSLCPGYWVGLHGSGPFLTPFVFVLFKYTILLCFGPKKKKGSACKSSLRDSISKWTTHGKNATLDMIRSWKLSFWDFIHSPKSSLLNLRC